MPFIVAATSQDMPEKSQILFVFFVLIVALGYGAACWLRPFTHCYHCKGTGRVRATSHRTRRSGAARGQPECRPCRATGLRLRLGRRAYNHATRVRREANR